MFLVHHYYIKEKKSILLPCYRTMFYGRFGKMIKFQCYNIYPNTMFMTG